MQWVPYIGEWLIRDLRPMSDDDMAISANTDADVACLDYVAKWLIMTSLAPIYRLLSVLKNAEK